MRTPQASSLLTRPAGDRLHIAFEASNGERGGAQRDSCEPAGTACRSLRGGDGFEGLDVGEMALVQIGRAAPDDCYSSFVDGGAAAVLTVEVAADFAPSAGLRNRLVHEYDPIDDSVVLAAAGRAILLYFCYVAAIERWLAR